MLVNRNWRRFWGSLAALLAAVGICVRGSSSCPTPPAPPVLLPSLPQESVAGAWRMLWHQGPSVLRSKNRPAL